MGVTCGRVRGLDDETVLTSVAGNLDDWLR